MVAHLQIGTSSIMLHRIGSWKCWFLRRGTAVAGEKPLGARNQQQTEPCTYGGAGIGWVLSPVRHACTPPPTPHPPPHGPWWDPGAKFQIKASGHHILGEWWMMPHSLFAFCAWRCYAVSKNLLIKLRDVIPGTFIQPLSTGVIHLTFPVQYLQNEQSSWLTVLAAY